MSEKRGPSKLRADIRQAVLELENFTIETLCSQVGLRPEQVYHEVALLKRNGYITSDAIHRNDLTGVRRPYRPQNIYRLTDDPDARYAMAEGMPLRVVAKARRASGRAQPRSVSRLIDLFEPGSVLRGLVIENSAEHPLRPAGSQPDQEWLQNFAAMDEQTWNRAVSQLLSEPGFANGEVADWLNGSLAEFRLCLKSQLLRASALLLRQVIETAANWAENPEFVAEWVRINCFDTVPAEVKEVEKIPTGY
jgi:hypothetical protein